MIKKKLIGMLFSAAVLTVMVAGCGGSENAAVTDSAAAQETKTAGSESVEAADGELSRIKESGKLVVGINADYAPFGFHAIVDGQDTISGVDVEVAKAVAEDMGVELELLESNFDMLLSTLQAGQCDVVISCLSPTEERKQQIDFSDAYSEDQVVAMVRKEDESLYQTFDDLKGKKIGCAYGTIQESLVKQQLPDEDVEYREGMAELFLELQAGQVDAVISTESVCKMAIASNPDLAIAVGSEFDTSLLGLGDDAGVAVGVRKDSQSVIDSINATIARLKEAGELEQILEEACELASQNASGTE